jgi:hypothetical protein
VPRLTISGESKMMIPLCNELSLSRELALIRQKGDEIKT